MGSTLAVFASGRGSLFQFLHQHLTSLKFEQIILVTNKRDSLAASYADENSIPITFWDRSSLDACIQDIVEMSPSLIVLAGFNSKIPDQLLSAFPGKIINTHPSLLPKFGGKGMYGMHVHKAVKANGERASGITIHYVNEQYDEGNSIFQASCPVFEEDTPQDIRNRVLQLEHHYFPRIIEKLIAKK